MATPAQVLGDASTWVTSQVPYVWGGITRFGADCSGFTQAVYAEMGYTISRTSQQQATDGTAVALGPSGNVLANAKPGDLLIYSEPGEGAASHVSLYAGGGLDYEESQPGQNAHLIADTANLIGIRRIISATGATMGNVATAPFQVTPGPTNTTRYTGQVSPSTGGGAAQLDSVTSDIGGAVAGPILAWASDYGVRAALVIFGAALLLVGLWRLIGGTERVIAPPSVPSSTSSPSPAPGRRSRTAGDAEEAAEVAG